MYRIGLGYDIHRLVKNRKLFIGGVLIPSIYGLDGHSDADVLIHSICDSILGALGMGDIGTHFSNKDPKYKNKKSTYFMNKVVRMMRQEGYRIVNIDSTLICEKPKLSRHRKKITTSLEKKLKIPKGCISIKATTSEGLGAIGEGMGIACKTIVLIGN
ncbi:MAG: 2-C-methyl-D-erythritol 2,4-cyclodiphosphate synthase [Thermodesulfobacteriota bacterium]|nr:2-C-methyl-D-erythritol 2,4-cyclodiphosphate synthase [Thermodesulfobacteriota bacterium]